VSPRSDELLTSARSWLARAEDSLGSGFPAGPVADAYFAMLYAARAALSEEGRNAKTHRGTWTLFGELFVSNGRFDRDLYRRARVAEERRVGAHYEGTLASEVEARTAVEDAHRFIEGVEGMLGS